MTCEHPQCGLCGLVPSKKISNYLLPRPLVSFHSSANLLLNILSNSETDSREDSVCEEVKGSPCSAKARFESFRARAKKLSLNSCIVPSTSLTFPDECKLNVIPAHMRETMKVRVADAELEEFSDYLEEFSRRYSVGSTVGEGTTGVVKKCVDRATGEVMVVKIVRTNDAEVLRAMKNEYFILSFLSHPNIVKARAMYYNPLSSAIYLVQEQAGGVDLSEYIAIHGRIYGIRASAIARQIIEAVAYMHKKGVSHRDLKPQNIIMDEEEETSYSLKIVDFNVSKIFGDSLGLRKMTTHTGTTAFSAPELLAGEEYTEKVDLWGVGTVLYNLLAGTPPFEETMMGVIVDKITRGDYDMERAPWPEISAEAKDLVRKLLEPDPEKRISAETALDHPWLRVKVKGGNKKKDGVRLAKCRTVYVNACRSKRRAKSNC